MKQGREKRGKIVVFSDQTATGVVYVAAVQHATGGRVKVVHVEAKQGDVTRFPAREAKRMAAQVQTDRDFVLVVIDTESHTRQQIEDSQSVLRQVRGHLILEGIPEGRVHVQVMPPCTEVLYFLHEELREMLLRGVEKKLQKTHRRALAGIGAKRLARVIPDKELVRKYTWATHHGSKARLAADMAGRIRAVGLPEELVCVSEAREVLAGFVEQQG